MAAITSALDQQEKTRAEKSVTERARRTGTVKRVLLAEDNLVNRNLAVLLLQRRGHQVTVACDGKQALTQFGKQAFDVVLMDVQMPEMDGFEATAAIRAREKNTGKRVPIIAMTAHAMKGDRERCLAAGMDGYLSKPIRAKDLIEIVEGTGEKSSSIDTPAKTATPEGLAFNESALLNRVGGDVEVGVQLASAFLEESPRLIEALKRAVAIKDSVAMNRTAHALKGSVSNFGVQPAVKTAFALEKLGKAGNLEGAEPLLAKMESQVRDINSVLTAFLEAHASVNSKT